MKKNLKKLGISLLLIGSLAGTFTPATYAKTTYYGNGVSCNSKTKKCWVDWGKTWGCVGNISVASWAGATIGKC